MGKRKRGWRRWAPVVMGRYWLFQGIHYMNWTERLHRLAMEVLLGIPLWAALTAVSSGFWCLVLAVLAAHTASMVLNGHPFALFKHDLYWFGFYKRWDDFATYVAGIQDRLQQRPCVGLDRAEVYGSLTRGRFTDSSDLDLRFMARPGVCNAWRVANRVSEERLRALLAGFPMDLYMFRSEAELARKIDLTREKPVVIFAAGQSRVSQPFRDAVHPVPDANDG